MPVGREEGIDRQRIIDGDRGMRQGMNTRDHPSLMKTGEAILIENANIDEIGRIKRRSGVSSIDSPTAVSEGYGIGLWYPPSSRGTRKLVGFWTGNGDGLQLWESPGDGDWSVFDTGVSLVQTLTQFVPGRAFYSNQVGASSGQTISAATLFVCSAARSDSAGSHPLSGLVYRHDITTETDRASQTFDVRPRATMWWQGRLWAANSACTAHGLSWLGWSDVFNGMEGWTDSSQNILVDPDDNDEITAIFGVRASQNLMYIWKTRGIWKLNVFWDTAGFYTESVDVLDTTESRLSKISDGVGCIATKSVQEVTLASGRGDVFFLAHDGIRSILRAEQDTEGGAGRPITDKNKTLVSRINFDHAQKAVAIVENERYRIAVPLDGAQENTHIIDVDLSKEELPVTLHTLAARDLYYGALPTEDFRTYMLASASWPNGSAVTSYHVFQLNTGTVDPGGSAIPFTVTTRGYIHTDAETLKRWDFIELKAAIADTAATFTVSTLIDEQSSTYVQLGHIGFNPSENAFPILPFNLPFNPAASRAQIKSLGALGGTIYKTLQPRHSCSPARNTLYENLSQHNQDLRRPAAPAPRAHLEELPQAA
jgi:hypothetical protein